MSTAQFDAIVIGVGTAPLIDPAQIGEIAPGLAQRCDGAGGDGFRRAVEPLLDVAPILVEQRAQIGEDARPLGHALLEPGRRRHLLGEPGAQPFLAEIPGDAQALRGTVGDPFDQHRHGA